MIIYLAYLATENLGGSHTLKTTSQQYMWHCVCTDQRLITEAGTHLARTHTYTHTHTHSLTDMNTHTNTYIFIDITMVYKPSNNVVVH